MTGGEILIECLKAQGVRCIFGQPGTQNIAIYDALLRYGEGTVEHYLVRHEYSATIMADGFARSTGEVGVALTVPGPGASNASTGLLEAYTDCIPVLLMTGQGHTQHSHRDQSKMFHGLDQMRFFEPLTKFCGSAKTVSDIPGLIEGAFYAMRSGRPGPTMLEFPMDVILGEDKVKITDKIRRPIDTRTDETAIQRAVQQISSAKRPLILAGSAVLHAGARPDLQKLAEKLQAPVVVTRCGKGVLDENHPLALQHISGLLGQQAIQHTDCTIAVGCRFTSLDTGHWNLDLPSLIQIDEDLSEIGREYECQLGLCGGLTPTLQALTDQLPAVEDASDGGWHQILADSRQQFNDQPPLPILPDLQSVLPADTILSVDVHAIGYGTFSEWTVSHPRNFLYPCIGVTLGYAFPAALGAKIANPDKTVVCFTGDGGFMMGASELATAAMYGINVVTIVVNDGALSAIKGSQRRGCEGRTIDTDLQNPDFVQLAQSFGVFVVRVDDLKDFKTALQTALDANQPAVIEIFLQDRQEELIKIIGWLNDQPLRQSSLS
ncbi:MAG: thiamine pyrophosphate-binding protein [Candidatus Poribacteria bacterium]|jgi:acetolactate synthase-1/2/3 large subunit|nr:thiamine pyrophosphate-binding protein [Candidatus Poribacteria bacterium]MDP6747739.1 thiamine pyrophosphate-binding protein [Candidatus Poribacteria bacterium]MDP6996504.1 thiamine pyrophosphate-binding protein [Candidatus Poribacteria bacterium]